ncbi:hypothetical protein AB1N83_004752 [Pleurotus pulmonarius]
MVQRIGTRYSFVWYRCNLHDGITYESHSMLCPAGITNLAPHLFCSSPIAIRDGRCIVRKNHDPFHIANTVQGITDINVTYGGIRDP